MQWHGTGRCLFYLATDPTEGSCKIRIRTHDVTDKTSELNSKGATSTKYVYLLHVLVRT